MSQAVEGDRVTLPSGRACLVPPLTDLHTPTGPPSGDVERAGPCPGSPSQPVGTGDGPALLPQFSPWLAWGSYPMPRPPSSSLLCGRRALTHRATGLDTGLSHLLPRAWHGPTCLDHPLGPWPPVRGLPFLLCQSANPGSRHTGSQAGQPAPLREAPQDLCPCQH